MKSTKSLYSENKMLHSGRKIPLNTIVLPPLSPFEDNSELQIFHNLLIGKPNGGTMAGELVTIGRNNEKVNFQNDLLKEKESARIVQLEQNIHFLQEQHTQMLAGLHKEINNLSHKNRELQFQLVFTKGGIPSSPSSPEDDTKPKINYSPKQINVTPLQVELLEKELGELKLQLEEMDYKNTVLSNVVNRQIKNFEKYKSNSEQKLEQAVRPDPELLRKIDDAEALIRSLRKENAELRQEHFLSSANSAACNMQTKDGTSHRVIQSRGNSGRHRGNSASHYRGNWFPPLHTQNYWNGRKTNDKSCGCEGEGTPLPSLPNTSGPYHQNKRGSNSNHHRNSDGRVHRSGGSKLS